MENVYRASKAVILYLIILLILQTFFGEKTARNMSLMILFSMLILNSETFASYVKDVTEHLTLEVKTTSKDTNKTNGNKPVESKPSNYITGENQNTGTNTGNQYTEINGNKVSNYLTGNYTY